MARNPRAVELSSHSPSRHSARARDANAAPASASPRSWARKARRIAIRAGTFTSMLPARPTVGSNGSPAVPGAARSAASSNGSISCTRPLAMASCPWASSSRGRDRTRSSGNADSHR